MVGRVRVAAAGIVVGGALTAVGAVGVLDDDRAAAPRTAAADRTTTTEPAPAPDETPAAFLAVFGEALSLPDPDTLFDRLHPAVLERYGEDACRQQLGALPAIDIRFDVRSVSGPASWAWELDGRTTEVPRAYTVEVTRTVAEQASVEELHLAPVGGRQRWFTDCGDPLG